jgi:hypothetical protein
LWVPYSSKLIPFYGLLLLTGTTETSFIYKVWQLLLHEFLDLRNSLLKALFAETGDVQVQRRVLLDN